jgi:peptidase M28-like protein
MRLVLPTLSPFEVSVSPRVSFVMMACAAVLLPQPVRAQGGAGVARATGSITPADVLRRIGILSDDSMLGRATPSPQLEQVARYVAGEFRRFGLKPLGDSGGYIVHYPIIRQRLDLPRSTLTIAGAGTTTLKVGVDVNFLNGLLPARDPGGPVVLLVGMRDTLNPLGGADVRGAWVAEVVTAGEHGVSIDGRALSAALHAGAVGVLLISNRPEEQWQNRLGRLNQVSYALGGVPVDPSSVAPWLEIRDANAAAALGIDPSALRGEHAASTRRLDGVTVTAHLAPLPLSPARAPNVIGVLEGSDPTLRREYVFLTGHMDHIGTPASGEGCAAKGADTICNGADDDASGTTAVLELAQAFSRLTPRPRRSLVFMTVSGEERGLWGSTYYVEHPRVPLAQTVADLNTDMIGRNWTDSIVVIGKEHSDLGATLNRIGAEHPELHMKPTDDIWPSENFYFRSDHYNFARKGVPILFFFNGVHSQYHQPDDQVGLIDGEKESRVIKLDFYLALAVANATPRPRWNPASYDRIVEKSP